MYCTVSAEKIVVFMASFLINISVGTVATVQR